MEQKQERQAAFTEKMGLKKQLCACASCGIRDPALHYEKVPVETLPSCFRFDEAACKRRERLGHVTLLGQSEPVDLRPIMSCFECNHELYHLHPELVDVPARSHESAVRYMHREVKVACIPCVELHASNSPPKLLP